MAWKGVEMTQLRAKPAANHGRYAATQANKASLLHSSRHPQRLLHSALPYCETLSSSTSTKFCSDTALSRQASRSQTQKAASLPPSPLAVLPFGARQSSFAHSSLSATSHPTSVLQTRRASLLFPSFISMTLLSWKIIGQLACAYTALIANMSQLPFMQDFSHVALP